MEMAAANVTTSNNEVQAEAVDPEGSRPASPKAPVRKHRAKIESAELTQYSDVPPPKSDILQTVIIISRVITDNSRVTAEMTTITPENIREKIENSRLQIQAAVIEESKPIIIADDLSINTHQKQAEPDDDRGKEDTKESLPVVAEEIVNESPNLPENNNPTEAIPLQKEEKEITLSESPEIKDLIEVVKNEVEESQSIELPVNDVPKEINPEKLEDNSSTKLKEDDDPKKIVPVKLEEIETLPLELPAEDVIPPQLEEKESESPKLIPTAITILPDEVKITPPKVKDGKSQVKVINAAVKVFNKLMPGKKSSTVKSQTSTENIAEVTKEVKENEETKTEKTKTENTQTKIPQIKSKIIQAKNDESKVENKEIVSPKKVIPAPKVLNSLATVVDEVKKQQPKDDSQPSRIAFINQRKKLAESVKSQQSKDELDQAKKIAAANLIMNHPKIECDATILKRLRVSTEQLNQENTSLKKVLESERSAFREHRALHEAEMRKERAEGKRREGALEGQLRSALKGLPQPSHGEGSAQADAAKLVSALQAVKSANKSLQDKLQVVTEADKRKVSEIRAQHDAHATRLQQMEREARAQTAKLLEELKTKERQLEQVKRGARGVPPGGGLSKLPAKMAVAEQLLAMEDQISRLENELQRRDDIIRSLRNSRPKRQPISRRASRENLLKDTTSDFDSAVSSAPNSLSPQPSPDLWFHSQEASRKEVDESLLEVQRRQIQELEKALNLSSVGQRTAQLRATQLEEQLQDLREQADLLEFRCLELEDTSEKRNSLEELTDSDSGCTSPEDRLKNSVSPQLRRSDSGYKSPTHQPTSPSLKNRRILSTPITGLSESESAPHAGKMHLQVNDHTVENGQQSDDIRDRLERMLLKTHNETDRNCLEQVLQLLWNLQALSSNLSDEDFSMIKNKKTFDNDNVKNDFEQTKTSKIIATISPYSQTSPLKIVDVTKSISNNEPDLLNILIKEESKKLLYGLQESGIFDETDWDNKSTQTDWCDCAYTEPQSDLATEVQRLNQIREQLEKSGAIRNNNFKLKQLENDIFIECNQTDAKQQSKHERKLIDFYEKRNALLESKISIYESSEEVKQKKLAQRLQIEIDLQSKVEILETDLDELQSKYIILEEERCEIEEEENDTRLHCQELEAEFELLSAKLRDMDEQRMCAKNESDCYRELVQEYEDKSMCMAEQEKDLKERLQIMEKTVPALIFWNIYKLIAQYPEFDFKAAYNARFGSTSIEDCPGKSGRSATTDSKSQRMIGYCKDDSCDPLICIEKQLRLLDGEKKDIQKRCKEQEDMLRKRMAKLERNIVESKETCLRQEEEANNRIKALEKELSAVKDKSSSNREKSDTKVCISDAECTKKLQAFKAREKELKCHIEELQKKEEVYINTLNQGDEMWAEMEQQYKQKIKEYEENEASLTEKIHRCESDRNRWKVTCEPLEQKVRELEESEAVLETGIRRLQDESQNLLSLNEDLSKQTQNLKMELTQSKAESKFALESLKMSEDIQVELKIQKSIQMDLENSHSSRVIQMRREISKSSKDLLDLDVTNGELKEEVDTLEKQVTELSNELTKQREEAEEKIKSLLKELLNKSNEYDELEREITAYQHLPSAHEELQQFNKSPTFETGFNNKIMCSCNGIYKQREDSVSSEDLTCNCTGKNVSVETSDKAVMTDPPIDSIDGGLSNKNNASTPNVTLSSTTNPPSQSALSTDGQSGQHRQKPELPKRKPKVTPKPHLPLKNEENKKIALQRSISNANKPSQESIARMTRELTGSLLTIIQSKDKRKLSTEDFVEEKRDLEKSILKMINDSLDVCTDESAHPSCREEESNVSGKNARNINARVAPEEAMECKRSDRETSPHVQEPLKIFKKVYDNSNMSQNTDSLDEKLLKYTSYETPVRKKDTKESLKDNSSLGLKSNRQGSANSSRKLSVSSMAQIKKLNAAEAYNEICHMQDNEKISCFAKRSLSKRQSVTNLSGKCDTFKPLFSENCSKRSISSRLSANKEFNKSGAKPKSDSSSIASKNVSQTNCFKSLGKVFNVASELNFQLVSKSSVISVQETDPDSETSSILNRKPLGKVSSNLNINLCVSENNSSHIEMENSSVILTAGETEDKDFQEKFKLLSEIKSVEIIPLNLIPHARVFCSSSDNNKNINYNSQISLSGGNKKISDESRKDVLEYFDRLVVSEHCSDRRLEPKASAEEFINENTDYTISKADIKGSDSENGACVVDVDDFDNPSKLTIKNDGVSLNHNASIMNMSAIIITDDEIENNKDIIEESTTMIKTEISSKCYASKAAMEKIDRAEPSDGLQSTQLHISRDKAPNNKEESMQPLSSIVCENDNHVEANHSIECAIHTADTEQTDELVDSDCEQNKEHVSVEGAPMSNEDYLKTGVSYKRLEINDHVSSDIHNNDVEVEDIHSKKSKSTISIIGTEQSDEPIFSGSMPNTEDVSIEYAPKEELIQSVTLYHMSDIIKDSSTDHVYNVDVRIETRHSECAISNASPEKNDELAISENIQNTEHTPVGDVSSNKDECVESDILHNIEIKDDSFAERNQNNGAEVEIIYSEHAASEITAENTEEQSPPEALINATDNKIKSVQSIENLSCKAYSQKSDLNEIEISTGKLEHDILLQNVPDPVMGSEIIDDKNPNVSESLSTSSTVLEKDTDISFPEENCRVPENPNSAHCNLIKHSNIGLTEVIACGESPVKTPKIFCPKGLKFPLKMCVAEAHRKKTLGNREKHCRPCEVNYCDRDKAKVSDAVKVISDFSRQILKHDINYKCYDCKKKSKSHLRLPSEAKIRNSTETQHLQRDLSGIICHCREEIEKKILKNISQSMLAKKYSKSDLFEGKHGQYIEKISNSSKASNVWNQCNNQKKTNENCKGNKCVQKCKRGYNFKQQSINNRCTPDMAFGSNIKRFPQQESVQSFLSKVNSKLIQHADIPDVSKMENLSVVNKQVNDAITRMKSLSCNRNSCRRNQSK